MTLLTNSGILPLQIHTQVALIGPHIFSKYDLLGSYMGQPCPEYFNSMLCMNNMVDEMVALNVTVNFVMLKKQIWKVN